MYQNHLFAEYQNPIFGMMSSASRSILHPGNESRAILFNYFSFVYNIYI
jgi:hypothetical protein